MIIAIVIALGVVMLPAGAIGAVVDRHSTIKMARAAGAGAALIAKGVGLHNAFHYDANLKEMAHLTVHEPPPLRRASPLTTARSTT